MYFLLTIALIKHMYPTAQEGEAVSPDLYLSQLVGAQALA